MDADGSNQTNLTDSPAWDLIPRWSPDGSKIGFLSHRDGNDEIYVMDADGSNPTNLTNNPAGDGPGEVLFPQAVAWSPDGSKIAFVTPIAVWSPDGKTGVGTHKLYIADADGSNPPNLTESPANDFSPAWSP